MNFTVVWKPEAERRLATIWTDAEDRAAIARAADAIDSALAIDPEGVGESRSSARRILLEPPLGVIYRLSTEDRMVIVLTVWSYRRGGSN